MAHSSGLLCTNYGLRSMNYGLLWGKVAYDYGAYWAVMALWVGGEFQVQGLRVWRFKGLGVRA